MKNILDELNKSKINLDEYEEVNLNDIEKAKMKKNFKKSLAKKKNNGKYKKVIAASAVFLGIGLVPVFSSDAFAGSIEKIGATIESFFRNDIESIDEYKMGIGQSGENKDVKITLNDFIIDGNEIIVSSNICTKEAVSEGGGNVFPQVYINGVDVFKNGGGGSSITSDIDENNIKVLSTVSGNEFDFPKEILDVKIVYEGADWKKKDILVFEFKYDNTKMEEVINTIEVNKKLELDGGQIINITNIKETPLAISINYTMEGGDKYDLRFEVFDQDGEKLNPLSGSSMGKNNYFKFENYKDLKKIDIKLYLTSGYEGEKKQEHEKKEKFPKFIEEYSFNVDLK